MIRKALLILAIIILLIQMFRPEQNISASAPANAIEAHYPVSKRIGALLRSSCYDCHSNNTVYPWYSKVQPFAWWLRSHITEGKRELNFDEFNSYDNKKKKHKLDEVVEMIEKNEMPLSSYTLIHKKAVLSSQEKNEIIAWAKELKNAIH
ncbi:heme-binding domain-containing protein [Pedobacter sp. MC2016-24]|uniref:heme-binding domain-containing protein n=1 Tax=Pedobacter sp. MC2016-24 TaxID=2780090 RepID=UPI001882D8EA|nr:heme-binding domain-containing protein [Pedobacter sp. MC2016-24]MBE9599548.1 heme-binding domain-containing protein [Pedobacter sp. MC2016-24]